MFQRSSPFCHVDRWVTQSDNGLAFRHPPFFPLSAFLWMLGADFLCPFFPRSLRFFSELRQNILDVPSLRILANRPTQTSPDRVTTRLPPDHDFRTFFGSFPCSFTSLAFPFLARTPRP